jgi:hypothetical protein
MAYFNTKKEEIKRLKEHKKESSNSIKSLNSSNLPSISLPPTTSQNFSSKKQSVNTISTQNQSNASQKRHSIAEKVQIKNDERNIKVTISLQ